MDHRKNSYERRVYEWVILNFQVIKTTESRIQEPKGDVWRK